MLTVADGVGERSDVIVGRQVGVAVGDDHVAFVREAGDRRQDVAVEPRLGGDRQERDSDPTSFVGLRQRRLATFRVAVRQHDGDESNARPSLAAQRLSINTSYWNLASASF